MDSFDRMFKIVFGMIITMFVLIAVFWIVVGTHAISFLNSDCEPSVIVEETNNTKTYSLGCKE